MVISELRCPGLILVILVRVSCVCLCAYAIFPPSILRSENSFGKIPVAKWCFKSLCGNDFPALS